MRIARCLPPLCFGCLILFLSYSPELQAQSQTKDVAGLIEEPMKPRRRLQKSWLSYLLE